jgi:ABC-2 type transport system ATP-binding protein
LYEERYRLIGAYSTGMKQRVKLAQALVHDPELLLLDEPTNGLDPEGRGEMLGLVERTGREFGITVLVTSHLLGEIERVCDHLVAIEQGRLVQSGAVATYTGRTRQVLVEIDDDGAERFARELERRGVVVQRQGYEMLVTVESETAYDVIRDVAADLDVPLARIEPQRHRLGELFRGTRAEAAHV